MLVKNNVGEIGQHKRTRNLVLVLVVTLPLFLVWFFSQKPEATVENAAAIGAAMKRAPAPQIAAAVAEPVVAMTSEPRRRAPVRPSPSPAPSTNEAAPVETIASSPASETLLVSQTPRAREFVSQLATTWQPTAAPISVPISAASEPGVEDVERWDRLRVDNPEAPLVSAEMWDFQTRKLKEKVYVTRKPESLRDISRKLFATDRFWLQIWTLNPDIAIANEVPAGTRVFLGPTREMENSGERMRTPASHDVDHWEKLRADNPEVIFSNAELWAFQTRKLKSKTYEVKHAQSLQDVSRRLFSTDRLWLKLWSLNPNLEDPSRLVPGTILVLDESSPSREALPLQ